MEVRRGTWKGQRVAIKYIRTKYSPEQDEQSKAKAVHDYRKSMYDLNFELQVMSKASLRRHRNIAGLLAVCFDTSSDKTAESSPIPTAHPALIVALAHEQYPDLKLFFDHDSNPGRPDRLPFQASGTLIADIADGITALHDHDLVHADLKPQNILIFPDANSPCGVVAKIADFGFLGMVVYSGQGRAPLPDGIPRGGTLDWNAPECLEHADNLHSDQNMNLSDLLTRPQYQGSRDIYSFGLVSCYIALDGQPPSHYIPNLVQAKLSGETLRIAEARLRGHYSSDADDGISIRDVTIEIARNTLNLDRDMRWKSLRDIREMIFGE
jgi:serine/threonine protein kinase